MDDCRLTLPRGGGELQRQSLGENAPGPAYVCEPDILSAWMGVVLLTSPLLVSGKVAFCNHLCNQVASGGILVSGAGAGYRGSVMIHTP